MLLLSVPLVDLYKGIFVCNQNNCLLTKCNNLSLLHIAIQVAPGTGSSGMMVQQTPQGPRLVMPQRVGISNPTGAATVGGAPTVAGTSAVGGLQLLQTSSGQLLLTTAPVQKPVNQTMSQGIIFFIPLFHSDY